MGNVDDLVDGAGRGRWACRGGSGNFLHQLLELRAIGSPTWIGPPAPRPIREADDLDRSVIRREVSVEYWHGVAGGAAEELLQPRVDERSGESRRKLRRPPPGFACMRE